MTEGQQDDTGWCQLWKPLMGCASRPADVKVSGSGILQFYIVIMYGPKIL